MKAFGKMQSSGMLRLVALVRIDVLVERTTFIIRATRFCELGTTLAVLATKVHCMLHLLVTAIAGSYKRAWPNIPEDSILYSHSREHLKSYTSKRLCGRSEEKPKSE
jgi:hypothetical protein